MEYKDLNYWKNNCEENLIHTPISVLRYIQELENAIKSYSGLSDEVLEEIRKQLETNKTK